MTRVNVSTAVLSWALERSGKDVPGLRPKFPKLHEWLDGRGQPTLHQLESFAKATSTPLGYLFLAEPPDDRLPIPYYRSTGASRTDRPSPDLLETVQTMKRRQAWVREYLIEDGEEPLPLSARRH